MATTLQLKRVYQHEGPRKTDGTRFLVERLWPRGIKKERLPLDGWLRDVGPSAELRKWFHHDPARWEEFQRRYDAELDAHSEAWEPILQAARRGRVTLLYSSRDTEHNSAVALRDYLERKLHRSRATPS
ncbi:DUF488 family protein [Myxococcaceae bacterium GXIMD 01537]